MSAVTVEELADGLGIDGRGLARTVDEYNAAVQGGEFDPTALDGVRTARIYPPKSNWALPLDEPPYLGYAVTCGITFTFGGLKIDDSARVLDTEDVPLPGLYAAGELVGGLFYNNYPAVGRDSWPAPCSAGSRGPPRAGALSSGRHPGPISCRPAETHGTMQFLRRAPICKRPKRRP